MEKNWGKRGLRGALDLTPSPPLLLPLSVSLSQVMREEGEFLRYFGEKLPDISMLITFHFKNLVKIKTDLFV